MVKKNVTKEETQIVRKIQEIPDIWTTKLPWAKFVFNEEGEV
jgi:hypothetical protein